MPTPTHGPETPSLRVLHVLAPAAFGGLERVVSMLVAGQRAAGMDARIAAIVEPGDGENGFVRAVRDSGAPVRVIEVAPRAYIEERRRVRDACRSDRPDVVHLHGYKPDVLHGGIARRLRIPTVTTVHGFTGGDAKNRLYERLQRRSFRRMSAVVAVSAPLAERLREWGVPGDRVHCVVNAWSASAPPAARHEAREKLGLPSGFQVGFVGRLSQEKGADVLLEALARVDDAGIGLAVIGDGGERGALEGLARTLGIEERVRWLGAVPAAGHWIGAFDALAISSRTEGTPIVLFEAMEAGVPVIASRVGGIPDVVGEDEAILVPSEDPDALARAIRSVAGDPEGAAVRAGRARELLRANHDPAAWVERYRAVYGAALGTGAGR